MGVVLPAGSGLTGRCRERQQLLPALQPSLGRGRRQPCGAPRWHANRRRCCPPLPSGHWHRQLRVEVGHRAVAVAPAQPLTVVRLQHKLDAPARPEAGADRLETPAAHRSPPPPPPPPPPPRHATARREPPLPTARPHTHASPNALVQALFEGEAQSQRKQSGVDKHRGAGGGGDAVPLEGDLRGGGACEGEGRDGGGGGGRAEEAVRRGVAQARR